MRLGFFLSEFFARQFLKLLFLRFLLQVLFYLGYITVNRVKAFFQFRDTTFNILYTLFNFTQLLVNFLKHLKLF